jgi:hypothetical protein
MINNHVVVEFTDDGIKAYGPMDKVSAITYSKTFSGSVVEVIDSGELVRYRPHIVLEVMPGGRLAAYGLYAEQDANTFKKNFEESCTSLAFVIELYA